MTQALPSWLANHLVDRTDRKFGLDMSSRWSPDSIDDYFIDMRCKAREMPETTDGRFAALRAASPVQVCQTALGFFQQANDGADAAANRDWFLKCADLLLETQQCDRPSQGAWLYHAPSPYRSRVPWVSAMAQGEALSVLTRAHRIAPQSGRYEAAAQLALLPFLRTLEEGGVTARDDTGRVCLEEYPSSPPSHVLNGWIFAWMGLKEYACAFEDQAAHAVAQRSLESLGAMLQAYDTGYWSSYDLFPGFAVRFLASRFYHRLHIAQLTALYRVSGRDVFLAYASRWSRYLKAASCNLRYGLHRLSFKTYCLLAGWR